MNENKAKGAMGIRESREKRKGKETPKMREQRKAMQKTRPSVSRKGTRGY